MLRLNIFDYNMVTYDMISKYFHSKENVSNEVVTIQSKQYIIRSAIFHHGQTENFMVTKPICCVKTMTDGKQMILIQIKNYGLMKGEKCMSFSWRKILYEKMINLL